jgi:hypothetical protein
MNSAIELHDSLVTSLIDSRGSVQLCLEAYIHKALGKPGVDPGSGFVQNVIIDFVEGRWEGEIGDLPTDILQGNLQVGESTHQNMLDLPFEVVGAVTLNLFLSPDFRKLSVSGSAMKIGLLGADRYIEEFRR